ncbi:M43 family zinc metalloprotease [Flavobacterium okayamense]|uniref:Peptidase n=1 Tax=Flavobacterium okayamense TaxID=2830782 RepID=A0ABM7S209_9FLAO|nr:M43 family zinc metalloprotease [Flavobacterium okayamense]BCY27643.1 peptidase [Flavobacterium okayamense]
MKKTLLLIFSVFALVNLAEAQTRKASKSKSLEGFEAEISKAKMFSPKGVVRCATVEYNNSRKLNGRAVSDKVFEDWLAPKIQEIKKLRQAKMLPSVIRIPVVVHVIHNGDAVGSGENIADGQVLSQIQVFNEDFRKLTGTPGDGAGVDTTIEFCLAAVDPNGNATNGIDRVNLGTANFNSAAVEAAKASTIWDPTKYLNCWTFRFGGDLNGVLGYAQFPTGSGLAGMPSDNCVDDSGSGASTDGVVCAFDTWGSSTIYPAGTYGAPYDKGRTMTHEVGHMLGLRHIWGDGGCGVDDYCADTPLSDASNFGCPTTNSCTDSPIDYNDQVQNYMDYTDDTCMNMFTQDQTDRMLAVMANSPRRDDLLMSNVCDAIPNTPYIQFKREACLDRQPKSVIEGNGCSYTEFTIPLSIDMAPSQNATATFALDGMSVADLGDVQIMTPSVTFNAGSTADQNLVFRVLNDGIVEADEDLMITFTVTTSGNALENPKGNVYTLSILNDDATISANSNMSLFYDDFSDGDASDWSILDNNAEPADDWFLAEEANWASPFGIYTDFFMASYSWNGVDYSPDNFLSTPAINIPVGASNIQLDYFAGSGNDSGFFSESYQVWVSNSIGSFGNITSGTLLVDTTIPAMGGAYYNLAIPPAYSGQTVYITFRHYNTTGEWVLGVDEVEVSADVTVSVQTATDVATAGQNNLNGSGSTYFRDSSSGNIIGRVQVNDASNYGCSDMYVSSAGTGATQYGPSTNPLDFRMDKQFTIVPSNIVAGSSTITFYFTEAEIAGWEAATGNSRTALYVVKDNGSEEIQPCSIGAFGSDVTLTASFATGIDGVFSFARQQSLGNDNFELTGVTLYPNPNNGVFNLSLNTTSGNVKVEVFDTRGRLILNKLISGNGMVNETISLQNAQSGIYLVNIEDGSRKVTKKIVVK